MAVQRNGTSQILDEHCQNCEADSEIRAVTRKHVRTNIDEELSCEAVSETILAKLP